MDPELASILSTRERTLERLRGALIKQLRLRQTADELDPDAPLFGSGLGLDSLDAVELVVCLENEFGIHIADDGPSPARMRTLNSIVNLVLAAKGGAE